MSDDVGDRVKRITVAVLKVDEAAVSDTSRFVDDLGGTSIQSIELVAAFEEEFDIDMDQDEALTVKNVGDAVAYIRKVIAEQHGGP